MLVLTRRHGRRESIAANMVARLCQAAGIIDPTKVVRIALENAVSVASVLLLTEATMTELPEPKELHASPLEPGME